jgi:hypothetical protein
MEDQVSGGEVETEAINTETETEPQLRRSTRSTQPSSRLRDYVTYKVIYPIQDYVTYEHVCAKHKAFLISVSNETEPNKFLEAKESYI